MSDKPPEGSEPRDEAPVNAASDPESRQFPRDATSGIERALRDASYEVLPFRGAAEKVLEAVPRTVALTVTTTEAKGLEPTVDLASSLARDGYDAAPHLAARLVRDRHHLAGLLDQAQEAGVKSLFLIGGDATQPVGAFESAAELQTAILELGYNFQRIGVGGYPEGHPKIGDADLMDALRQKAPHSTHLITQLCFDPRVVRRWVARVRAAGINTPVRVGIPGAVNRQKLIRVSAGLGLGQSARFLKKQQNMFWRFFLPGGYSPNRLIKQLGDDLSGAAAGTELDGLHVFTFNELKATETWRQDWLSRLQEGGMK